MSLSKRKGKFKETRAIFKSVFLSRGFRPFFLFAGLYAIIAVIAWLGVTEGIAPIIEIYPGDHWLPSFWHGHEMLFGFTAAVIGGFFLTAVPNWTGSTPVSKAPLAILVMTWLGGRIAMWMSDILPLPLVALVDLAFLPALAATILLPLRKGGTMRSFIFPPLLLVMTAGNLLFHLDAMGVVPGGAPWGLTITLDAIALLIAIIGGRVTPGFTRNALKHQGIDFTPRHNPQVDRLGFILILLVLVCDASGFSVSAGWAALGAALALAIRLSGWGGTHTLGQPILFVLHLGYGWLVLGLLLKGISAAFGMVSPADGIHGLAIGAIGTMTLAMMSRASLGHSGGEIVADGKLTAAYFLVTLAAVMRIVPPLTAPDYRDAGILASGIAWIMAFTLFCVSIWPVLTRPRADGEPG